MIESQAAGPQQATGIRGVFWGTLGDVTDKNIPSRPPVPARPTVSGKPPAILLHGVPDNQMGRQRFVAWDKPPQIIMQGTASFLTQMREPPLRFKSVTLGGRQRFSPEVAKLPSVNFMADADRYGLALRQAQELVKAMGTPCFNHPSAVLATTRDGVARALDGVGGLLVPRTVRVTVNTLAQLKAAKEAAGIRFPVIVRLAGDHGGVSTARVNDEGDWEALNPLGWGGRPIYLTQFVDYADADGRYRKLRLVVVGGQVFARHQIVSDNWLVHRRDRALGSDAEEQAFMESFDAVHKPRLLPMVQAVAKRLGLDYFGMDVSLRPDGSVLLFEANATMNLLSATTDEGPAWTAAVKAATEALYALLGQPRRWHGAAALAGGAP